MEADQISGCDGSIKLNNGACYYTTLQVSGVQFTLMQICGYNGRRLCPTGRYI
jgi:hypothetical protein